MPATWTKEQEVAWFERLRRGQALARAARELSNSMDSYRCPTSYDQRYGDTYCTFCHSYNWVTKPTKYYPEGVSQIEHKEDCEWAALRRAVAAYDEVDEGGFYLSDECEGWGEPGDD